MEHVPDTLAAMGGVLRCHECDHEERLAAKLIAYYLRNGWPRHCGYTMEWVTQRLLDAEKGE